MICPKCGAEVWDGSLYCNFCGKKLISPQKKRNKKSRGNGSGCAYQRPGQKTWTVEVVVGKKYPNGDITKPKRPVRKTRGGFATKRDALAYASTLRMQGDKRVKMTLEQVYLAWKESYASRVGQSTMDDYYYAYKHFMPLHGVFMDLITAENLQKCMDDCKSGKRTHENMRCIANLLWKYAVDKNLLDRNIATNLYIGKGVSVQRDPVTEQEVAAIRESISAYRYADYVLCLCYLGFRPGEMLELKKDMLHCVILPEEDDKPEQPVYFFVNGKKTEAGKDRIVVVSDQILDIVLSRLFVPGTDYVFPQYCFNRKKMPELVQFKQMSHSYFNKMVFKPLMEKLGFPSTKVPYSCRHTFADLLKDADGTDKGKSMLIGHSSYMFTRDKYQSTNIQELKAIIDSFKKL